MNVFAFDEFDLIALAWPSDKAQPIDLKGSFAFGISYGLYDFSNDTAI